MDPLAIWQHTSFWKDDVIESPPFGGYSSLKCENVSSVHELNSKYHEMLVGLIRNLCFFWLEKKCYRAGIVFEPLIKTQISWPHVSTNGLVGESWYFFCVDPIDNPKILNSMKLLFRTREENEPINSLAWPVALSHHSNNTLFNYPNYSDLTRPNWKR